MFDKLDIVKIFFDKFSNMFGDMFGAVFGAETSEYSSEARPSQDDYEHVNIMFDKQSEIGRAKGEMRSTEPMRNQIKKFYDEKNKRQTGKNVVVLENFDEEDTLG